MKLPSLGRCIRRSALAAVCLLAAAATPALAAYDPSGPQKFVDKSQLDGWQLCFSDIYGDNTDPSLSGILSQCNGDPLMLAGGPTGSPTLTVLAAAPRADVIFDTGGESSPSVNVPHDANGTGWYFNSDWSWGFAKQGDPIQRVNCDILGADGYPPGPNGDLRLCWHTGAGDLTGGWRAGVMGDLFDDSYTRYIYQGAPLPSFSFAVSGRQLIVSVPARGAVSVSDAAAPLSASAAKKKKKRKLLLKPSSASGGAPTITVPLLLTKAAKSRLKEQGKVKAGARITFTPQGSFPSTQSSTQTAKLKIKGKRKKK